MRRTTARGRIFPQSLSTDPRYGRLSLKALALFPLIWTNCDDQGRISGDFEEIKYAVCPSIDHITKLDIPDILKELEQQRFVKLYSTSKSQAIQMLDWWEVQKLQWAWPSEYAAPEGWQDRLRYKKSAREVVTSNWGSPEASPGNSPEASPERSSVSPLTTPIIRGRGRGRGISPERSGERSGEESLPLSAILDRLKYCYESGWGKQSTAKVSEQFRDLAGELVGAGCTLNYIDEAFKEAAVMNKYSISYVRAMLLDWLGVAK